LNQKVKSHWIIFIFALTTVVILSFHVKARSQHSGKNSFTVSKADSALFYSLVAKYARSIDQGDTVLASEIWAKTGEVSFIHPRGNEYGWEGVKKIIKMFHDNFTFRKLSCFNLKTATYKDVAWLEFFWVFDATMKPDNTVVQTKGRETQIWKKTNHQWQLVHVHYSGMPVTGQGQGF
jgi:hypothetical protein